MAELILTEEEKAAPLWSDLSDEALGKLMKKKIAAISSAAKQNDMVTLHAAAMMLCLVAVEHGVDGLTLELNGVNAPALDGDWQFTVTAQRVAPENAISAPTGFVH